MPRYFFHVVDGVETIDSEGTVLANVEEARAEAIVLSGAMLRDSGGKFWNNGQWQLRVVDATGNKVCGLHSRPIALKGAVTAFLEAMLGVVPRLGGQPGFSSSRMRISAPLWPSLATGGRRDPTGGARGHGETCRGGARAHACEGRPHHASDRGSLPRKREALADL